MNEVINHECVSMLKRHDDVITIGNGAALYAALDSVRIEMLKRENEKNCELAEAFCEYIATHSREIAEYIADLMMKADSAEFELACIKAEAKKREVANA